MSTQAGHLGQQSQPSSLEKTITPQLLGEVRDFWFSHLASEDAAILPGFNEMKRWFMGGEELDTLCSERFKPVLEAIKSSNATPEAIISDASPSDPGDWLALVLLLDQFPRNCYRGSSASLVFLIFDPLAQAVARKAIDLGIPFSQDTKYYLSRRMWFYLPLMHSEDLALHDQAVAEYERMGRDFKTLMTSSPVNDAAEERCRQALATDKRQLKRFWLRISTLRTSTVKSLFALVAIPIATVRLAGK
ncbi:hypothetical protein HYQ44_009941 [Verticillium longisporum]|nr:hypothetical protein HYQ44_009941 [Verticillium longisporum]